MTRSARTNPPAPGERFGRLVVLGLEDRDAYANRTLQVQCDCGAVAMVRASNLTSGNQQSCGCYRREASAARAARQRKERRGP